MHFNTDTLQMEGWMESGRVSHPATGCF
jgi:hypothetical protein